MKAEGCKSGKRGNELAANDGGLHRYPASLAAQFIRVTPDDGSGLQAGKPLEQ